MKQNKWIVLFICFIIPLLLLTACVRTRVQYSYDVEAQPYIAKFEALCNVEVMVNVQIVDFLPNGSEPDWVGECDGHGWGNHPLNQIYLLRYYWNQTSDYGREQLIFHELGHCVLGRGHNSAKFPSGAPVSIMFPYVFGESAWYYDDYAWYYKDLCQ